MKHRAYSGSSSYFINILIFLKISSVGNNLESYIHCMRLCFGSTNCLVLMEDIAHCKVKVEL